MRLDTYAPQQLPHSASLLTRILWYFIGDLLVQSRLLPFSPLKSSVLRFFGAKIGRRVVIKPGVRIKYPWNVQVGDYSWIGENVWIDNLAPVRIGSHVCISQGAYLCTGSHNWKKSSFDLITKPIVIEDQVWIAAQVCVSPGTHLMQGVLVTLGSVVSGTTAAWSRYCGNPATLHSIRPQSSERITKRFLFVNQTYWPDYSASASFLTELTRYLVEQGHDVHVLTSSSSYNSPESPTYPRYEVIEGVHIYRVAVSSRRETKIGRIFAAVFVNLRFSLKAFFLPYVDTVVTLTTPPLLSVFFRYVSFLRGSAFIVWILDLNPDQAVVAGWIRQKSFLARLTDRLVGSSFRAAQALFVLDRYMHKKVATKEIPRARIFELPLWVDTDRIFPIPHSQNNFRKENFSDAEFVVMYAGNVSLCHPIETILQAAYTLREDTSIVFVFNGGGPRLQEIKTFIDVHHLKNIKIIPYQPHEYLPEILSSADLHVISMGESFVGILHPSKIYGVVASGRPYIYVGPSESFIAEEFVSQGIGDRINNGDVQGFVELISRSRHRSDADKENYSRRSREAIGRFEKDKILKAYGQLLGSPYES